MLKLYLPFHWVFSFSPHTTLVCPCYNIPEPDTQFVSVYWQMHWSTANSCTHTYSSIKDFKYQYQKHTLSLRLLTYYLWHALNQCFSLKTAKHQHWVTLYSANTKGENFSLKPQFNLNGIIPVSDEVWIRLGLKTNVLRPWS